MRTYWMNDATALSSHAAWRDRISKKNRQPGTSAPTIAAAWAGPVELHGALASQPHLAGFRLTQVTVERQSHFDRYAGPRNHDLVAYGELPTGETVAVCVEAKAGEDLDRTVERYGKDAQKKHDRGERTDAPERLAALLNRYVPYDPTEERVRLMRYQFLSALAGTESEADSAHADHAVLMLHDFITNERPADKALEHAADWHRFCTTVFDCEPPDAQQVPWCIEVPSPESMNARLYLAWAITDLRDATLMLS